MSLSLNGTDPSMFVIDSPAQQVNVLKSTTADAAEDFASVPIGPTFIPDSNVSYGG